MTKSLGKSLKDLLKFIWDFTEKFFKGTNTKALLFLYKDIFLHRYSISRNSLGFKFFRCRTGIRNVKFIRDLLWKKKVILSFRELRKKVLLSCTGRESYIPCFLILRNRLILLQNTKAEMQVFTNSEPEWKFPEISQLLPSLLNLCH